MFPVTLRSRNDDGAYRDFVWCIFGALVELCWIVTIDKSAKRARLLYLLSG